MNAPCYLCPRRSSDCHLTCAEYAAFTSKAAQERAERYKKAQAASDMRALSNKRRKRVTSSLKHKRFTY